MQVLNNDDCDLLRRASISFIRLAPPFRIVFQRTLNQNILFEGKGLHGAVMLLNIQEKTLSPHLRFFISPTRFDPFVVVKKKDGAYE